MKPKPRKTSILMVCLGNICRSPLAEGIMRHIVEERGLSDVISVDSCGTSSYHVGEEPHPGSAKVARQNGVSLRGIQSRQLHDDDFDRFDWLIAMDSSNLSRMRHVGSGRGKDNRMVLLLDYARGDSPRDVPDPYYEGGFPRVFDLVKDGCEGLLDHILEQG